MSGGDGGIFFVKARKCLRCGRILTGRDSVEIGYGCRCAELEYSVKKAAEPMDGQMSILDFINGNESEK